MPRLPLVVFLVLSAFPAASAIVAGPEQPVSELVLDVPAQSQEGGRIAAGDDGFLVVWTSGGNILGVRLSREGTRLGERPLAIAATPEVETAPELAFGGGRYLVTWRTGRGTRARMVAPDGTMAEPVTLAEEDAPATRVAFNGERFLAVWRSGSVARAALVDIEGRVRSRLELGGELDDDPKVVAAQGAFFVATRKTDAVALTPITAEGTAGSPVAITPAGAMTFDLAAQNHEVVVAWNEGFPLRAVVIDPATGAPKSGPLDAGQGWMQSLVSDPAGVVLVYDDGSHYARRLGSGHAQLLARPRPVTNVRDGASNGARIVLATEGISHVATLYIQRAGDPETEPVALAPRHQVLPEIATMGDASLVVWSESVPAVGRAALLAARVGSAPVEIAANVPLYTARRVAAGDGQWLVVWQDSSKIHGARVSADGRLPGEPFLIADGDVFGYPGVAWDGSAFVVVFLRGVTGRFGFASTTVTAVRISADGTVGDEIALSANGDHRTTAIAAGREGVAVVWLNNWLHPVLHGALLSRGGTVTPLAFPQDHLSDPPAVAWNGRSFLVAAPFGDEIRWLDVSETGVVTQPPATAALPSAGELDLAAFGERFLLLNRGAVALVDPRGWSGPLAPVVPDPQARISGSRIAYARAIDPAWPDITRVFVRELALAPDPPRRRATR